MCRWLVAVVFGLLGFAPHAEAQIFDTPTLRGTTPFIPAAPKYRRWDGFYAGGQVGYSAISANFNSGVSDLVANILRNTTVQNEFAPSQWVNLPSRSSPGPSYGGFLGYNIQFEDTIIGVEGNYSRVSAKMSSSDTIARNVNTSDGYSNDVTVSGSSSFEITDVATVRMRAGWVKEAFMPYGFLGVAVGRGGVVRSASVSMNGVDADPGCVGPPNVCLTPYSFSQSQSDVKNGTIAFGWTIGAGFDWLLSSSVFLRTEYEYVSFPNFRGVSVPISTGRAAAGLRF
jgi:opacity protein-like surface antigen